MARTTPVHQSFFAGTNYQRPGRSEFQASTYKGAERSQFLLALKKGKKETLRKFCQCLWEMSNEVDDCSEEMAMLSYVLDLLADGKLWDDLILHPPADTEELMLRIKQYVRLEDEANLIGRYSPAHKSSANYAKRPQETRP